MVAAPNTIPTRMCAACHDKFPKTALRRYTLDSQDQLVYDKKNQLQGRGIYVCSQQCYDKIQRGLAPILQKAKQTKQRGTKK